MDDILTAAQTPPPDPAPVPVAPVEPPPEPLIVPPLPPVESAPPTPPTPEEPKKKGINRGILIAGILLLLVSLPLIGLAIKNSTELRSRASSCSGDHPYFCSKCNYCASDADLKGTTGCNDYCSKHLSGGTGTPAPGTTTCSKTGTEYTHALDQCDNPKCNNSGHWECPSTTITPAPAKSKCTSLNSWNQCYNQYVGDACSVGSIQNGSCRLKSGSADTCECQGTPPTNPPKCNYLTSWSACSDQHVGDACSANSIQNGSCRLKNGSTDSCECQSTPPTNTACTQNGFTCVSSTEDCRDGGGTQQSYLCGTGGKTCCRFPNLQDESCRSCRKTASCLGDCDKVCGTNDGSCNNETPTVTVPPNPGDTGGTIPTNTPKDKGGGGNDGGGLGGQCVDIRVAKDGKLLSASDLKNLEPGDIIKLGVKVADKTTKARFRINGGQWKETTTKLIGYYVLNWRIPNDATTFTIEAQRWNSAKNKWQ